jgi:DNA-binding transcriptional ArsR family regulator
MPVAFDEYDAMDGDIEAALDPESNAFAVLSFLVDHPDTGFTPAEIHEATELPRGSVGTTLSRLDDRGLVRHKEPYWAADERGIEAFTAVLRSLQSVESTTAYDWGDVDPAAYRVGLDAVSEDP